MILTTTGLAAAMTPARAAVPDTLPAGDPGMVVAVVDGDTVVLDTGMEVRMVGIQAPKLPLGRRGFRSWPLAEEAKVTLETLVANRRFTPHFGGRQMDRHGRALAHLVSDGGIWLQGEMLRLGLARVYSFPDNTALVEEMLTLERAARDARFGIWSHPFYALRAADPAELSELIGTFQLVEGRILDAADVRGTVYLNHGEDWRTDFTTMIDRRAMKAFLAAGLDPATWSGTKVRVRGWLRSRNGPMIEATHPQQIELLDDTVETERE
ncbi:MAG: thermonuclease family protein [Minwuia sp.]|nr:thermonuclease family protein [Minwuia sp.]